MQYDRNKWLRTLECNQQKINLNFEEAQLCTSMMSERSGPPVRENRLRSDVKAPEAESFLTALLSLNKSRRLNS